MKRALLALCLAVPAPAVAEEHGFSLMEEGAQLILRGIAQELDPAIRELEGIALEMEPALRQFVDEMGPAFTELLSLIDSVTYYEPPEILENGDILIRRSPDAPPYVAPEAEGEDGTETPDPLPEIDL